jgi:hypothetical protein
MPMESSYGSSLCPSPQRSIFELSTMTLGLSTTRCPPF